MGFRSRNQKIRKKQKEFLKYEKQRALKLALKAKKKKVGRIRRNLKLTRYFRLKKKTFEFLPFPYSKKDIKFLQNLVVDLNFHTNFLLKALSFSFFKKFASVRFRTVGFQRRFVKKMKKIEYLSTAKNIKKKRYFKLKKVKRLLIKYKKLKEVRLYFRKSRSFFNIHFFFNKIKKKSMKKSSAFSLLYSKRVFFFTTILRMLKIDPRFRKRIRYGKKHKFHVFFTKFIKRKKPYTRAFKSLVIDPIKLKSFFDSSFLFFHYYSLVTTEGLFEKQNFSIIKSKSLSFFKQKKRFRKFGLFFPSLLRKYKIFNYLGRHIFFRRFYNLRKKKRFQFLLRKKKKRKLKFFALRKKFSRKNDLKIKKILENFDDASFIVNCIMKNGERQKAIMLFEKAMIIFKRELILNYPKLKSKKENIEVRSFLNLIITKYTPPLILVQKSIAGKKYKIPYLGSVLRRRRMTIRWLVDSARKTTALPFEKNMRKHKEFSHKLAYCLIDALRNRGLFIQKRLEYIQEYEKGRLFLRYLKINHARDIDYIHNK